MINIIYSEILKLKKSKMLLLSLTGALSIASIMNIVILISKDKRTFKSYVFNSQGLSFWMFYGILFAIIGGYVFSREYKDKTCDTLFSYSCSRNTIFLGKLFVVHLIIFFTCFIQSAFVYFSYYILFGRLEKEMVISNIKVNACAMLFQMAIVIIPIFLANLKKSLVLPIVYGIFNMCLSLIMEGNSYVYSEYNPLVGSMLCFQKAYKESYVDINRCAISGAVLFIVFSIISIYQYNKVDMA